MNIYLPIEVKVRELEGKTLLALTAAERGHTVIIGEKKDTINLAKKGILPPGIVHDKSLTPGEYKIKNFYQLKKNGNLITAQDEESGLLDESFDEFAKRRFSEETMSMADRIFAWGCHDYKSLKSIYPKFTDKIVATGSPRVDFWRSELNTYFNNDNFELEPYILVVSNFGFPIDQNPFWNRIARLRDANYFERDPEMEKMMYENTAYQYRLLYRFIEVIRYLAESFPDINIIVRPHPVESIDAWNKLLEQKNNIIINREKSISSWIRNASVIIHNGCTSALEAAVSGIPRIAYRPIPNELERDIPNNVSTQIYSLDALKSTLSDLLNKNKKIDTNSLESATEIVNNRFASLTDRFAADKIVDEWETIGKLNKLKTSSVDDLLSIKTQEKLKLKKVLKNRIIQIRNSLLKIDSGKNSKGGLLYTGHKFPSFDDDELRLIVNNLQNSLNRFQNVKFVRYGDKSFIFYGDK